MATNETTRSRGFTLVEALVAIGILAIAGTGMLRLLGTLAQTNQQVSGETEALALGTRLLAEIENAPYVRNGRADPGLAPGTYTNGLAAPGGSLVQSYGLMNPDSLTAIAPGGNGLYRVTYEVVPWVGVAGPAGADGVDIVVTVDNAGLRSANETTATNTPTRLLRPIRLATRRTLADSPTANDAGVLRW
jgi:prepilin-type N-terminal cleavage/methylation domain-containing protein